MGVIYGNSRVKVIGGLKVSKIIEDIMETWDCDAETAEDIKEMVEQITINTIVERLEEDVQVPF